eukprot:5129204-Pleurochrysis_carterae.AAC.1
MGSESSVALSVDMTARRLLLRINSSISRCSQLISTIHDILFSILAVILHTMGYVYYLDILKLEESLFLSLWARKGLRGLSKLSGLRRVLDVMVFSCA